MTVQQKPVTGLARRPKALEIMGEALMIDPPTLLAILQNQIMPNASNDEVAAFVIVCNVHGLNPILREIYAFPDLKRKRIVPVVGVDGWAKIVNRQEDYDGCEFEWHFAQDGTTPVACTCKLYHKKRTKPIVVTEYFDECKRNTEPWNGMPNRMLRHKAFIQAVRLAFGVAGIFDEDEARDIIRDRESHSFVATTPGLLVTQHGSEPVKSESVSVDGSKSSVEEELAPATPPSEPKAPEPDNRTPQQIIRAQLEGAGVDFETFRNYLVKQGIDKDGDSYANWDEVKVSTIEALGDKGVAKILKIYGSKGVAK